MNFLIVKCIGLDNEWNEVDKVPVYLTDDWDKDIPEFDFEVWELQKDNTFECILDCDDVIAFKKEIGFY